MRQIDHHIVGGAGGSARQGDVFDPNNGGVQAQVALGDRVLLDRAVAAANSRSLARTSGRRSSKSAGKPAGISRGADGIGTLPANSASKLPGGTPSKTQRR